MKQGRLLLTILLFLVSLSLCTLCGCSSDSSPSNGGDSVTPTVTISALEVVATPSAINPTETTTIEATAYDASGNTIADVNVVFTLDDPSMASITGTATTDADGVAQVFLIARDKSGKVNVTATAGSVISDTPATVTISGGGVSVDVTITALNVTATPDSINPNETTTIEATAYDASGNTIAGVDVVFTLDDPTLAFVTGTATTDDDGVAQVFLTARNKSGEINVTAASGSVTSDTPAIVTILSGAVPATINLTVNPISILVEGTTSVQAEVLDGNGDPIADGTTVSFTSTIPLFGDFTSPTSTTTNGFASATFEATNEQGTAVVTVSSGSVSKQADITIYPADAVSVEFVSATPQTIAIQGSGGVYTSVIQFVVKDSNGNPVEAVPVSMKMTGPKGGEKIDPTQGDPTPEEIVVSSGSTGIAQVILNSGSVAGPVTIQAAITSTDSLGNSVTITSQSSVVSIGGGVPSAKRFSVSASVLNLPGLEENNVETSISAYLADRFGNYNILVGTTVSFITELGLAIDTSDVTVDENGLATAIARTQYSAASATVAEDVAEDPWETALIDYIEQTYGFTLPGHPRDGLCSVMVYVKGEEHFQDADANGIYNFGETFIDTVDDPYVDYNDDGLRDNGSFDPFEEYIDSGTGNGVWNGKNNVWDSDKNIFTNFKILLSGTPLIASNKSSFNVGNGGFENLMIIVCDRNGNYLTAGSTVTITTDKGKLSGATSFAFPDTNSLGPLELGIAISDNNADETKLEAATITVSVTWKGAYSSLTSEMAISGTVE